MRHSLTALSAIAVVTVGSVFAVAQAQDRGDGPERERPRQRQEDGERGERRRFDPEQMRQRMMEGVKERLEANDEEWAVLQPRIEKVMEAQRQARVGGMGMRGGFGGRNRGGDRDGDQAQSPLATAANDLRQTLENESATAEQIQQRLEAFRAAREQAEAGLQQAQTELKELLTQRQEAQLVMMGMLE